MDRIKGASLQVGDDLHDTLSAAQDSHKAVIVRPPESSSTHPLEAAERLFADIHGQIGPCSFEIHQGDDGEIEFHVVTQSEQEAEWLLTYVNSSTEAQVTEIEEATLPVGSGQAVSIAQLGYARDFLLPLHNARSDGASADDPYRSMLDLMAESWGEHGVIQAIVEPVNGSWTSRIARGPALGARWNRRADAVGAALLSAGLIGGWLWVNHWQLAALMPPVGYVLAGICAIIWGFAVLGAGLLPWLYSADDAAEFLRSHPLSRAHKPPDEDVKPPKAQRQAAERVASQSREPGYRVSLRLLAVAEEPEDAIQYCERLTGQIENAYRNPATEQAIKTKTLTERGRSQLTQELEKIAARTPMRTTKAWVQRLVMRPRRRRPMFMSAFEIAALAHWPTKTGGGASAIRYAAVSDAEDVPPHAQSSADIDDTASVSAGAPTQPDEPQADQSESETAPDPDAGPLESEPPQANAPDSEPPAPDPEEVENR